MTQKDKKEDKFIDEYKSVIKHTKKNSDNICYLYIQLFFTAVMIVMSLMLKNGNK